MLSGIFEKITGSSRSVSTGSDEQPEKQKREARIKKILI